MKVFACDLLIASRDDRIPGYTLSCSPNLRKGVLGCRESNLFLFKEPRKQPVLSLYHKSLS